MGREYAKNIGKYIYGSAYHSLTASAAITTIDALALFDLTGVVEFSVENRTAALLQLDFSDLAGPVYVYPGDTFTADSGGKYSGTINFTGKAGTNVGAAVAGINPYIQVIAKYR